MSFSFKKDDVGAAIRDIQRKLASLDPKGDPVLTAFKTKTASGEFDADTEKAIQAFRRRNGDTSEVTGCDEKTWRLLNEQAGSVFDETWQFEIDALRGECPGDVQPVRSDLNADAHRHHFAGLAFSGGGIRSATFNLGMLQALAELKMLRDFDYLSTVSGGGYIGAWFSKWLKRQKGNIYDIERELTPGSPEHAKQEPEEVKFLRQYTNYLTPKTGFFSADTWALLTTYCRNTMLNLTILASVLAAVMVIPRLLAVFLNRTNPETVAWVVGGNEILSFPAFQATAIVIGLWSVFWMAASVSCVPDSASKHRLWRQSQNSIIWFILVPQMIAAFFGSAAIWAHHKAIHTAWAELVSAPRLDNAIVIWLWLPGVCYFAAWLAGWYRAQRHNDAMREANNQQTPVPNWKGLRMEAAGHFLCAVTVLAVGCLLVVMTTSALHHWYVSLPEIAIAPAAAAVVATASRDAGDAMEPIVPLIAFGIPIMLSLFGLTMALSVGLVGRLYTDKSREWWSRIGGWAAIFVIAWLALITVSLYAPAFVGYFHARFGDWASALLGTAWFGTTVAGLLLGQSGATGSPDRTPRLDWLARAAPPIFSVGALCIVSSLLHELVLQHELGASAGIDSPFMAFLAEYNQETTNSSWQKLGLALIGLLSVGMLLAWRVDINKFSLHMMYRNRLVRAYLGASNKNRKPHPFTGFDPADDEHMDEMFIPNKALQRPCLIVNTALNLVNGKELAWQTRKAANFTFTPAFCGFELPSMASPGGARLEHEAMRGGFRRTSSYAPQSSGGHDEESGINLGMAVAVSGAAASPSMGYHSSPPLAFLMTLFNVRLGRWFANPVRPVPQKKAAAAPQARQRSTRLGVNLSNLLTKSKRTSSPKPPRTSPNIGLWYLLKELFGLTDAKANFVYLSDGGHFENLGIYELVRRRCRLIVVVDAGADGQFDFADLGNAIRKCGTDLHVEVEIDVGVIDLLKPAEFSRSHCVTGTIRYDKVDQDAPVGTLLYIKPSLLGTEFADVLNYRKTNKTFPHQSTADQWFDETQFETYRSLGYNIGKIALAKVAGAAKKNALGRHDIVSLCDALRANWSDRDLGKEDPEEAGKLRLVENRRWEHRRQTQQAPNPPTAAGNRRQPIDRRQG